MRAQSAMEYLMTYGWAILIIAVVLGVLFQLGVFSGSSLTPRAQPGSCTVQRLAGQVSLEGECQGQLPLYVAQFNGQSSYLLNSQITNILPSHGSAFTIVGWVYGYAFNTGSWTQGDAFGFGTPASGNFISVVIMSTGSQASNDDCGNQGGSTGTMSTGTWYQVGMTYNGVTGIVEYINGVGKVVGAPPMGIGTSNTVLIGARMCTAPATYWYGAISNVQLYNASLTSSEMLALYDEGIGGAPVRLQSLVGWWPLNGNGNDYSGYNNNLNSVGSGTAYNSTWVAGYTAP